MEFGSDSIKRFQISITCHACGTDNTIVRCSGCGHFMDIVHGHCYNCGLVLGHQDDNAKAAPALELIILDYNGRPLISAEGDVMEYLANLVRMVKERAARTNLSAVSFVLKMSPRMWAAISYAYVFAVPSSVEGPERKRAQLKARQSIFVDDMEYPVELDEKCNHDILLAPQEQKASLPCKGLTAKLINVGS